jgi:signal peptidase I
MPSRTLTRALAAGLSVLALGTAWFVFAPPQLGGKTRLVVTSGSSMEPKIHRGDLAFVRGGGGDPAVGDVVLYNSHKLHRSVLHRIVSIRGDTLVMKGDNNDFRDAEHPNLGQVEGKLWFVLPGVGRAAAWVHRPENFAIILFLLVFGSLAGGRELSRRRHGPSPRPLLPEAPSTPREPSDAVAAVAHRAIVPAAIGLAFFALLAVVAWSAADVREHTQSGGYAHAGAFSYEATVPRSTVYPTGRVETGDAAFVKLVRRLNVSFTYRLASRLPGDVGGGIGLDARIADGAGWSRIVSIAPREPFAGRVAQVTGVLDLARLGAMGRRMNDLTGAGTTLFTLTLLPRVDITGHVGESVLNRVFAPELKFNLDEVSLRLDGSGEASSALTPRVEGTTIVAQPGRLELGPLSLPVSGTRAFAALGVATTLILLLGAVFLLSRSGTRSEDARIMARHGGRIVRAATVIPEGRWISDVEDIDALVRIAQHYDRVVLQVREDRATTYLVDDGVTVYRFRACTGTASSSQFSPAPR